MLEMLKDLINEHGSSTILKERLELFSDRYSVLEAECNQLRDGNGALSHELELAKTRIRDLEQQVREIDVPEILVSPDGANVLRVLFKQEDPTFEEIGRTLDMELGVLQYHLDQLDEVGLATIGSVTMSTAWGDGGVHWRITPDGRKVVVEKLGIDG